MGIKLGQLNHKKSNRGNSFDLDALLQKEIKIFGSRFGSKQKEQFYAELSVLLGSGIRLKDALQLLAATQKKKDIAALFGQLEEGIISGKDFSEILSAHSDFTIYESHSISIGEQSGSLTQVLQSLADFYTRKNEQRRNLTNALAYPIIVLITAFLAVIFMMQFVVPMFKDVFKQNNVDLPGITQTVIRISEWTTSYGWVVIVVIVVLFIGQKFFNRSLKYRSIRDRILLSAPFIGPFIRISNLARFTQAVSLLVSSKVSIPQSIKLAKEMINFIPLQVALNGVEESILRGQSLSESLGKESIFDPKMVALIKVAEETNATEYIFDRLNSQYNQAVLQQSKMFSTILEPAIIVIVGIIVGAILIAMYMPMFELGNVLK